MQAARLGTGGLARALGVNGVTVWRWRMRPDWPFGSGPWSLAIVGRVRAWRAAHVAESNRTPNQLPDSARVRLLAARASKVELERAILAGELIPRRDVESGRVQRVHACRAALEAMGRSLAPQLVGLGADDIRRELEQAIEAAIEELNA